MKLLPFDLQKAQAGYPWGTRDGRKGKKIFDTEREGVRLITVFEDNTQFNHCIDGNYFTHKFKSDLDLFLYEEEKIGWVVIHKDETSSIGFQAMRFKTEEDKNTHEMIYKNKGTYIDTVEVRY